MTKETDSGFKPDLPFKVGNRQELINSFTSLESNMVVQDLALADWLKAVKTGEKWTISPETSFMESLSNLYLAEKEDDLVIEPIKNRALENWERYSKKEERAYKRLTSVIFEKDDGVSKYTYFPDNPQFNKADKRRIKQIWDKELILLGKENFENSIIEQLSQKKEGFIKRSVNIQKKRLIKNSLDKMIDVIPESSSKIGRSDGSFFDMSIKSITLIDKGISYKAGLMTEEPGYKEAFRQKHPIGIIILPYHVTENGEYYVYLSPRNEPGALGQTVLVAGEQTSLSKMTGQDILKQPGGPVLATCAQEFGNIDCEGIPELNEVVPQINHIIGYGNPARMGGGFKVYATVRLEKDSSLFERYKGTWYPLSEVSKMLEETKNSKPMINELLGNCLFVLQTERIETLEQKHQEDIEKIREKYNEDQAFLRKQIEDLNNRITQLTDSKG